LGQRHIRYSGFQELAYLHPSRFTPDSHALDQYGLSSQSPFSVVRLGSWEASHDIGVKAMSLNSKMTLIEWLKKVGRTVILAEGEIPDELREMSLTIAPEDYHHLLYHAACVLTEGATTAVEASILGTPALYINPIRPAYLYAASRYGLLAMPDKRKPLDALKELLDVAGDSSAARAKARALVDDHCDVMERVVEIVEQSA
jgi:predicted glycosyltransferase